ESSVFVVVPVFLDQGEQGKMPLQRQGMVLQMLVMNVKRVALVQSDIRIGKSLGDLLSMQYLAPVAVGGIALVMECAVSQDYDGRFATLFQKPCEGKPVLKGSISVHPKVAYTVIGKFCLKLS